MSMKQHELNILKNAIEKAEGISARLLKWATDLHDFVKNEIAEEEAELAKLSAEKALPETVATNTAVETVAEENKTPAPAAPVITGNETGAAIAASTLPIVPAGTSATPYVPTLDAQPEGNAPAPVAATSAVGVGSLGVSEPGAPSISNPTPAPAPAVPAQPSQEAV